MLINVPYLLISLTFLIVSSVSFTDTRIKGIDLRIVGGTNATKFQFPHYVQIVSTVKLNESSTGFSNCGGSVISSMYILTAAHCVKDAILVRLILGFHTIADMEGIRQYHVKSIIVHDKYNATTLNNDIALIAVTKEINFTEYIKPIQFSCNYTLPDTKVLIAGTGLTDDVNKKLSTSVQWINSTIISNEKCSKWFSSIAASNICTIGKQKYGACHGDSGTALIRDANSSQLQIGILSWGARNRCELGYPSVFTRISDYIDWIEQHSSVSCVNEDEQSFP